MKQFPRPFIAPVHIKDQFTAELAEIRLGMSFLTYTGHQDSRQIAFDATGLFGLPLSHQLSVA
jgi:hypothetical protein